ncbi:MAG: preprotein translocase subunit SecG [Granulosicoccus sp.]
MQSIALVIHVILAVAVIALVLMQHGKGADAGAAFGSGASATVFGARGSASFLTRATTLLATAFFITSLFLFYLAAHRDSSVRSVTDIPGVIEEVIEPEAAPSDLPGGVESDSGSSGDAGSTDADMPVPAQ